jgi:hypothetical protein
LKPFALKEEVHFEQGPFLIASVLVGVGALLAFLGVVIGGLHSVNQGIRWAQSTDQSPDDVAKTKWSQLKAASNAGANAWKASTSPETAQDGND